MIRAVVTGGGTAGHINPALSIAGIMAEEGMDVLYIGSNAEDCLDRKLVGRTDYKFFGLDIVTPLLRVSLQTLRSVVSIVRAYFRCKKLFKKERPALVVGTGGFVSLPVMLAAVSLKIPTAIHEQNIRPGFTNRRLSRKVNRVFLTFAGSRKYFDEKISDRIVETGVPLLNIPAKAGLDAYSSAVCRKLRVLVVGGSLGSAFLNELVMGLKLTDEVRDRISIKLSCGQMYYDELVASAQNNADGRISCTALKGETPGDAYIEVVPYIGAMKEELETASLMICRAGSSTVFEGIAAAVPAIVIPSPNVAGDHQRPNAHYWADTGAAIYAEESELTSERLGEILSDFVNAPEKLVSMRAAADAVVLPDARSVLRAQIRSLTEAR